MYLLDSKNNKYLEIIASILAAALIVYMFPAYYVSASMPEQINGQSSFERWLLSTGKPVITRYSGYRANYEIYRDYRLLTYGKPGDVPGNRYDSKSGEYAVHGFSFDEFQVTNTYFPEDSSVQSDPRRWNNIYMGHDSEISWQRLSPREKEHVKQAPIYYMGKSFGGMTFSSLKLTEGKCVVIAVPSWYMGFALYTNHYNSRGEIRYGTLHGNGIGSADLKASFNGMKNTYKIPSGEDHIDITFDIRAYVSDCTGLAKPGDISRVGISFKGWEMENGYTGPWSLKKTVKYTRTSIPSRSVSEKAVIWAVTVMGDLIRKEVTCSFKIMEEPELGINGNFTIKGAVSFFRGTTSMTGLWLPYSPKRFLCLEKITLKLTFEESILPDTVRFYPVGGEPVTVEPIRTGQKSGYAQHSYTLDVLPSTITWKNARINPPHSCRAVAYFGDEARFYTIGGIDITGSVYDIVYYQTGAD